MPSRRPSPGVRPVPGPAGERPRLLAGGPGWTRVARRLRRTRGGRHRALASARGPRHRGAGGHTALLLDRGAEPAARAAGGASRRALPRSTRAGVLLQLGRGGERERPAPGSQGHRPHSGRLRARWMARTNRRDARVHRRRPLRGGGGAERHPALHPGAGRRRRGAGAGGGPDGRRGDPGAGAGPLRRAGPEPRLPARRPPGLRRSRRGADLRRGPVRRGALRRLQRRGSGGRGARRADLRQGPRLRSADRRRHRDAGDHRHHHHRGPGEHVRRRAGALRRRARHAGCDRARGVGGQRDPDRRAFMPRAPWRSVCVG